MAIETAINIAALLIWLGVGVSDTENTLKGDDMGISEPTSVLLPFFEPPEPNIDVLREHPSFVNGDSAYDIYRYQWDDSSYDALKTHINPSWKDGDVNGMFIADDGKIYIYQKGSGQNTRLVHRFDSWSDTSPDSMRVSRDRTGGTAGIAVDDDGKIYMAWGHNDGSRLVRFPSFNSTPHTVPDEKETTGFAPSGLTIRDGKIYIVNRTTKYTDTKVQIVRYDDWDDTTPDTKTIVGSYTTPYSGLDLDEQGRIYIVINNNNSDIVRYDSWDSSSYETKSGILPNESSNETWGLSVR